MQSSSSGDRGAARAAMGCAGAMIAAQVAGKATRDAIFLSTYDVTDLPLMLVIAAVISVVAAVLTTRLVGRFGPGRVVAPAFVLSAALSCAEWALMDVARAVCAVLVYLHLAVFGAILISGFWSVVNERFDPHTAKRSISKIAGGATLGGLAGGIAAERLTAYLSTTAVLLLLALLHFFCAALVLAVRQRGDAAGAEHSDEPKAGPSAERSAVGLKILAEVPYLRQLGFLVLIGTVASGLVDYVFKSQAVAHYEGNGDQLMRFFAVFYTGLGVVTFAVQAALGRRTLERFGLAPTAASWPASLMVGGAGALAVPGLGPILVARGVEAAVRSSLFRSAYELFYTPVSAQQKRATKTIVDVGFDRLGDAVGGGLIRAVLFLLPQAAAAALLTLSMVLAGVALLLLRRLQGGYVQALERSLLEQAHDPRGERFDEPMASSALMRTLAEVDLSRVLRADGATDAAVARTNAALAVQKTSATPDRSSTHQAPAAGVANDPVLARIAELRSNDARQVTAALSAEQELHSTAVPHVLGLLGWDEVAPAAVAALRKVADRACGQLVDALADADEEFAVRRRIPRVLAASSSQRALDGLLMGLRDTRFEVRFQCGMAMTAIRRRAEQLTISESDIHDAVLREVSVDERIWRTHRLLDALDGESPSPFVDAAVADRATRSLQHVFTLLALVLAAEPLHVAFRGLHTDDQALRGTALEYLETVLPPAVRDRLWPFLNDTRQGPHPSTQERAEALNSLLRSRPSIEMNLQAIRARLAGK